MTYSTFEDALNAHGVNLPNKTITNNCFTRWGKSNRFSAKRIGDGGYFHDFKGEISDLIWFPDTTKQLNQNDDIERRFLITKTLNENNESLIKLQENAAKVAAETYLNSSTTGRSCYLDCKKIKAYDIRFVNLNQRQCIIIPAYDIEGNIRTYQRITDDGKKYFLKNGVKLGSFNAIGKVEPSKPIIFCEGYATGASIYEATLMTTIICFDSGNLLPVVKIFRAKYPTAEFIIAGDNDIYSAKNTGELKAKEAAEKYLGKVVLPEFSESSLKHKPTDFNDLMIYEGNDEVKKQFSVVIRKKTLEAINLEDLFKLEVPKREMLIAPIIPVQGLVMLHAARGVGKTYVGMTLALTVASGGSIFGGKWSCEKAKKVLYLDGEMPLPVVRERFDSLTKGLGIHKDYHKNLEIITPDLQEGCMPDIATREGQSFIEEHLAGVDLIILDNLSALCLTGKENEAESWIPLQRWLLLLRKRGLSVFIIHHSNKKFMQRGTSKKEDLLDTVITLKYPQNYEREEGARFEVHYEKARGFYGYAAVPFEASLKSDNDKIYWEVTEIESYKLEQAKKLKSEGLTQREIGEILGISAATVNRFLKEDKASQKKIKLKVDTDDAVSLFHSPIGETMKQKTSEMPRVPNIKGFQGVNAQNMCETNLMFDETKECNFEERAAIMEYDGNINKDEAEILALEEVTQITVRKQRENE